MSRSIFKKAFAKKGSHIDENPWEEDIDRSKSETPSAQLRRLRESDWACLRIGVNDPLLMRLPDATREQFRWALSYLMGKYGAGLLHTFLRIRQNQCANGKRYLRQLPADAQDKIDTMLFVEGVIKSLQDRRSRGGRARAADLKKSVAADRDDIRERATRLLQSKGREKHEIVGIIASTTGFSKSRIYRALRDHTSGHWTKKS